MCAVGDGRCHPVKSLLLGGDRRLAISVHVVASRAVERVPQEHFEQFVEFAPDAIVAVDADRRIVLVNAQTEAIFGHRREELTGRRLELLVRERFRAVRPAHVLRYFAAPRGRGQWERGLASLGGARAAASPG